MPTKRTRDLINEGVGTFHQITAAIRCGKLTPRPAKDCCGQYVWTPEDVERLKAALATDRRRKRQSTGETAA